VVSGAGSTVWGAEGRVEEGRRGSFWWREIVKICDGAEGLGVDSSGSVL
jgi:hypothetical protein